MDLETLDKILRIAWGFSFLCGFWILMFGVYKAIRAGK